MSYGDDSWPFDDELLRQVGLFETLKRESSALIAEDSDALLAMATDVSAALGHELTEEDYHALCRHFLDHAIHLSIGKIVPVLLRLLKEEDMEFLNQLATRCPPNWIGAYKKGSGKTLN
jgi:hypothetical protein